MLRLQLAEVVCLLDSAQLAGEWLVERHKSELCLGFDGGDFLDRRHKIQHAEIIRDRSKDI